MAFSQILKMLQTYKKKRREQNSSLFPCLNRINATNAIKLQFLLNRVCKLMPKSSAIYRCDFTNFRACFKLDQCNFAGYLSENVKTTISDTEESHS